MTGQPSMLDQAQAIAELVRAGYSHAEAMRWWCVANGFDGEKARALDLLIRGVELAASSHEHGQSVLTPSIFVEPAKPAADPAPCANAQIEPRQPAEGAITAVEPELTSTQALIWHALAYFAGRGEVSPSYREIANRAGVPRGALQSGIGALVRKGYVRNDGEIGAPRYALLRWPEGMEPAPVAENDDPVAPDPDPVVQDADPVAAEAPADDGPRVPRFAANREPLPPAPPMSASERTVLRVIAEMLGDGSRTLWTDDIAARAGMEEKYCWFQVLALMRMGAIRREGPRASGEYTLLVVPARQGAAA